MLTAPGGSGGILFLEDFSSPDLSLNWIFYGDPPPVTIDSLGVPPPCFCNRGDGDRHSGVISREVFPVGPGFFLEADMYVTCLSRGTWVDACMELITPGARSDDTSDDNFSIASMGLSYSGELDWNCPHRQGVLDMICRSDRRTRFSDLWIHQNGLLDSWHTYRMEINDDLTVSYFVDDSLFCLSPIAIPDTCTGVRIRLGNRSSQWGAALHDNLRVGRR